ncbi:MAG: ATP-grasp domain-containing protein, partial [Terriglobia bacterium]
MHKIGIIFGMEDTFPWALIDRIHSLRADGITAEAVKLGGVRMAGPSGYRVLIDRISHDIPFYRAYLKNAALCGTVVINNPFWWSADDKFFNYALASKIGVAVPRTVILPHKTHPPGTTEKSMRNLIYPLNWDEIFGYVGFPAFLKPFSGGGWKNVYKVHNPEELFRAYDETGDLCMTLQQGIEFDDYFRCYAVGQEKVH